jgi:hypothetical protein
MNVFFYPPSITTYLSNVDDDPFSLQLCFVPSLLSVVQFLGVWECGCPKDPLIQMS